MRLNTTEITAPNPKRLLDCTLSLREKIQHVKQDITTNTIGTNGMSRVTARTDSVVKEF